MKSDQIYLRHMLEAIHAIRDCVGGLSFETVANNRMLLSSVVREFQIIGQAAKNVSEEFKEKNQAIPWKKIIGMRNIIIHEYFQVDVPKVWDAIQKDLPQLEKALSHLIDS